MHEHLQYSGLTIATATRGQHLTLDAVLPGTKRSSLRCKRLWLLSVLVSRSIV